MNLTHDDTVRMLAGDEDLMRLYAQTTLPDLAAGAEADVRRTIERLDDAVGDALHEAAMGDPDAARGSHEHVVACLERAAEEAVVAGEVQILDHVDRLLLAFSPDHYRDRVEREAREETR